MADWSSTNPAELLAAHLKAGKNTRRAYTADLATFREYLGVDSDTAAVEQIAEASRGAAKRIIDMYISHLEEECGASPATVRRKVGSLLGLLRQALEYDVIPWAIPMRKFDLQAPTPVRDTRGPGRPAIMEMMGECRMRQDAKGARDYALLCLLYYCALRCNEILTLKVKHLDLPVREIRILPKGRHRRRIRFPIPMEAARAIAQWLEYREGENGVLFTSLKRGWPQRKKLTYRGFYEVISALGRKAGLRTIHPHGLRHSAATDLARLTNGNIHLAMALMRHKDLQTLMLYQDRQQLMARNAMEILVSGRRHFSSESLSGDNPCYQQFKGA